MWLVKLVLSGPHNDHDRMTTELKKAERLGNFVGEQEDLEATIQQMVLPYCSLVSHLPRKGCPLRSSLRRDPGFEPAIVRKYSETYAGVQIELDQNRIAPAYFS